MSSAPPSAPFSKLNRPQRLVFEFLIQRQNNDCIATISVRKLAHTLGLTLSSCRRAIHGLNECQMLDTYSRSRKNPSEHRILIDLVRVPHGRVPEAPQQ